MSDGVFDPGKRLRSSHGDGTVPGGSLSARRLREIETLLGVVIDPAAGSGGLQEPVPPGIVQASIVQAGLEIEAQALELLRAFSRITDPETRREALRLVQAAARGDRG
ncbi:MULTISPECIES: hypothetical protein [Methylobacterium]|uniref:hypothetical protein n=1 Tax=Methylobacterium TaxID=407 RepID=UPI0013EB5DB0|nr:hypothetical protein [Methylobacterium sp. DB0501]NGM36232.1 hypothetical protein [Methylobacterium sp. DB0501]